MNTLPERGAFRPNQGLIVNTNVNAFNPSADGVYLITVTPFKDGGELDLASTDRMVDFCLDRGVTGLTILGIMGEATKLTAEESRVFVKQVLARVQGKVPVVVGASAAGFAPMGELTKSVMDMGASGVIVACDMPEKTVYEMVKAMATNVPSLVAVSKAMEGLTPKVMASDIGVPLHPGAAKYYKEVGAL
jgi:hypothetical protein